MTGLVPARVQPAYAVQVVAPTARSSTTTEAGSTAERASLAVAVTVTVPCTTLDSAETVTLRGVQSFAATTASAVVEPRLQARARPAHAEQRVDHEGQRAEQGHEPQTHR